MKIFRTAILALTISAASLAMAQDPPAPPADGKHPPMMDCSKAPDADKKARCEARQKARAEMMEKCKGMAEQEHRKCMMEQLKEKRQEKAPDKGK